MSRDSTLVIWDFSVAMSVSACSRRWIMVAYPTLVLLIPVVVTFVLPSQTGFSTSPASNRTQTCSPAFGTTTYPAPMTG